MDESGSTPSVVRIGVGLGADVDLPPIGTGSRWVTERPGMDVPGRRGWRRRRCNRRRNRWRWRFGLDRWWWRVRVPDNRWPWRCDRWWYRGDRCLGCWGRYRRFETGFAPAWRGRGDGRWTRVLECRGRSRATDCPARRDPADQGGERGYAANGQLAYRGEH
jgi:hypothetical protein